MTEQEQSEMMRVVYATQLRIEDQIEKELSELKKTFSDSSFSVTMQKRFFPSADRTEYTVGIIVAMPACV